MNKEILVIFFLLSSTTAHPSGKPPHDSLENSAPSSELAFSSSAPIAIPRSRTRTPRSGDIDELRATGQVSPSFVDGTMEMLKKTRETPPSQSDTLHRSLSDAEIAAFQEALKTPTGKKGSIK